MGTHPIFESDFDCLTELKCRIPRQNSRTDKSSTLASTMASGTKRGNGTAPGRRLCPTEMSTKDSTKRDKGMAKVSTSSMVEHDMSDPTREIKKSVREKCIIQTAQFTPVSGKTTRKMESERTHMSMATLTRASSKMINATAMVLTRSKRTAL